MTNTEKIASVVQRIIDQVLEETYDKKIFDEIHCLSAYLWDPATISLRENNLLSFEEFSLTEMKKAHTALKEQLLKEINHKEISFLQTMRLVQALQEFDVIVEITGTDCPKMANPKLKFCLEIWKMELSNQFELVNLLDNM